MTQPFYFWEFIKGTDAPGAARVLRRVYNAPIAVLRDFLAHLI